MTSRVVITGMAVNTPLGDSLDGLYAALMANESAITRWRTVETDRVYGKIGGDLGDYDFGGKIDCLANIIPEDVTKRLRRLARRAPWSTTLSMLVAVDAFRDAGLFDVDIDRTAMPAVVAAHNQNSRYIQQQFDEFNDEPEYIDPLFSLHALDTDHAGSVSEVLQLKGPLFTVGGACASGGLALRSVVDEVRFRGAQQGLVVAAALDIAAMDLQGMALMGAISYESFNDKPEAASRPYDKRREGFVPAHGCAALVVETLDSARRRGAHIYAEVLSVEANSDGNHLPQPSEEGQGRLMALAIDRAGLTPSDIDFVSAHATSTPLGDITELRSIEASLGDHARKVRVNAPKSMLGHTCWAAPTVELVCAIMQMREGRLHRSINVDELDPDVALDICHEGNVDADIRRFMKNSFGFGGINCVGIFQRYDG